MSFVCDNVLRIKGNMIMDVWIFVIIVLDGGYGSAGGVSRTIVPGHNIKIMKIWMFFSSLKYGEKEKHFF